MSLPPWADPTNGAYIDPFPNDVPKRSPSTTGGLILTSVIVGIFGVLILINFLMQWF